jgi:hypothetical protein
VSIDRRFLLGALLGLAAAVVLWGVAVLAGNVPSLLYGPSCGSSNPDGSFSQGACPPVVIPQHAGDSVPVTVEAAMHAGSIEGGMQFLEARSADGQLVWYQPMVWQPDGPAAIGASWLPPGSYVFTFYVRSCVANCGTLAAPGLICTFPFNTEGRSDFEVVIEWDWSREPCASERPATR